MEIVRDTRPNRFYPIKGSLADSPETSSPRAFVSVLQGYVNKYWSLSDKQVLAYNSFFCGTVGQPPPLWQPHLRGEQ
jgi:hypothetical protein